VPIEMMPPNQNPKYATGLIPLKSAPACWRSGPRLMCGSFGLHRSTPQTGARSVQPFLHDLWLQRTHRPCYVWHLLQFSTSSLGAGYVGKNAHVFFKPNIN